MNNKIKEHKNDSTYHKIHNLRPQSMLNYIILLPDLKRHSILHSYVPELASMTCISGGGFQGLAIRYRHPCFNHCLSAGWSSATDQQ